MKEAHKIYYLVYKITNRENGKYYIGAHKTKNKNDSYMGSGNLIKEEVKKLGKDKFIKEILYELNSEEEMYIKEREVVEVAEHTYNLINGGGFPLEFTDEIKAKIGKANSVHQKGEGNSQYGTFWVNNGVINKRLNREDVIPESFVKGRLISDEQMQKLNKNKHSKIGLISITNGINNIQIKNGEPLPKGYIKGRIINFEVKQVAPSQKFLQFSIGSTWHTNGKDNLIVYKGDTPPLGFTPGRTMPTNEWFWATNGVQSIKQKLGEPLPEGFYKGKVYKKPPQL